MGFAMLGTLISAGSSIMGGIASSNAADYQAQIARNNAVVAQQNAQWTSQAGTIQATNVGLKSREEIAQYKAGTAAKGIDVNTGSVKDVEAGATQNANTNVQTTQSNAEKQAYGYITQQKSYLDQASALESQASFDIFGGILGAAGSLAGGIGNFGSMGSSLASGASSIGNLFAPGQVNTPNLGSYLFGTQQANFGFAGGGQV